MKAFFLISCLLACSNYYAQDTLEARVQFNKHVEIGDLLYSQKDFIGAIYHYGQACKLIPYECPTEKLVLSKEMYTPRCGNEYSKLLTVADRKFDEKDYLKAKEYYRRATLVRPSDPYPKQRMEELEKLLNE